MRHSAAFVEHEHGQAVVELALLLPVMVLVLFGALEFGRAFNAWIVVTQAAREGSRVAAVRCSMDPLCSTAVGDRIDGALAGLDLGNASWSLTPGPYASGQLVQVAVEYDVAIVTPLVSAISGGDITVRSESSMRLE